VTDQIQVSEGEGAAEAGVGVALGGHERMFASWSSSRYAPPRKGAAITPMVSIVSFLVWAALLG
jgi:hypothetical protein